MSVPGYNELAQQQRACTATIQEATNTIVSVLETKLQLAAQQKQLQAELGIHYPEHSPADVRRQVVDVIVRRLEARDTTQLRDWTTRLANSGGNLED